MNVLRRLATSSAVSVVLATVAVVAACSTSTSGDDTTGGGGTPGTGTFCQAETAWVARCGTPAAACDANLVTNCAAVTPEMNAALLDAARDCLQSATSCDATPTGCLAGAALTAAPTTAQKQIESDYCTKCQPSGSDDCEQVFFTAQGPVGDVSTEIVPYSDAIAAQIDACTAGAGCASTFVNCAENAILGAFSAVSSDTTDCVIGAFKAGSTGDDDDDAGSGAETSTGSPTDGSASSDGSTGVSDGSADASGDGGNATGGTCNDTYEPNNTADVAYNLGELDDSAGTKTITASIAVAGEDVDWYVYTGNDAFNTTTSADPYAMVTSKAPLEICVWAKETGGYTIPIPSDPSKACLAGTLTPFNDPSGLTFDIGCCSTSTTAQIYNYGRVGENDSSTIIMQVSQMTSSLTCTDYSLTYAFVN